MKISVRRSDNASILDISGNIDMSNSPEVRKALLREIRENTRLGPSTGSIVEEAISRDIPWIRLNNQSLVQLGYGKNQVRFRATMTEKTSSIAVEARTALGPAAKQAAAALVEAALEPGH